MPGAGLQCRLRTQAIDRRHTAPAWPVDNPHPVFFSKEKCIRASWPARVRARLRLSFPDTQIDLLASGWRARPAARNQGLKTPADNGQTIRRPFPSRPAGVQGQQSHGPRWDTRPVALGRADRAGHARTHKTVEPGHSPSRSPTTTSVGVFTCRMKLIAELFAYTAGSS